ncbi:hypothetical protein [Cyprinid herpesvirus 2]|nr:hypothetical protein [Cyprinid herpesvirus 2]
MAETPLDGFETHFIKSSRRVSPHGRQRYKKIVSRIPRRIAGTSETTFDVSDGQTSIERRTAFHGVQSEPHQSDTLVPLIAQHRRLIFEVRCAKSVPAQQTVRRLSRVPQPVGRLYRLKVAHVELVDFDQERKSPTQSRWLVGLYLEVEYLFDDHRDKTPATRVGPSRPGFWLWLFVRLSAIEVGLCRFVQRFLIEYGLSVVIRVQV